MIPSAPSLDAFVRPVATLRACPRCPSRTEREFCPRCARVHGEQVPTFAVGTRATVKPTRYRVGSRRGRAYPKEAR